MRIAVVACAERVPYRFLPPLLFFLTWRAGSAQTIRRTVGANIGFIILIFPYGSVDVSPGDWSQLGRLQRYKPEPFCWRFWWRGCDFGDTVVGGDTVAHRSTSQTTFSSFPSAATTSGGIADSSLQTRRVNVLVDDNGLVAMRRLEP
jgi:hypothetical protein